MDNTISQTKDQDPGYKPGCAVRTLHRISDFITTSLEAVFYRAGCMIGLYPWATICISLVVTAALGCGLTQFYEEKDPIALWVPPGSLAQRHKHWVDKHFGGERLRYQSVIVHADNVLEPETLAAIAELDGDIKAIDLGDGIDWYSLCARMGSECWSSSVIELWRYNQTRIAALSLAEVQSTVTHTETSPVLRQDFDAERLLGKISRDENGTVISSQAAYLMYVLHSDASTQLETAKGNKKARRWEEKFMSVVRRNQEHFRAVYYSAQRSQDDAGRGAVLKDADKLFISFGVLVIFITISLGQLSMVYNRLGLTLCGLLCVCLAYMASLGLGLYTNTFYGPIHTVLPFLLLGVGVDDMFVIAQAWDAVAQTHAHRPHHERVGLMLSHAGVSITVTSITDFVAFGIGATTIIPALRSFCIYASIGILLVYGLQASLFVACLSLDTHRAASKRNALLCCYIHKHHRPWTCSNFTMVKHVFQKGFSPLLSQTPVKIVVLVLTGCMLAQGIYGLVQMPQDFDERWLVNEGTYLHDYLQAKDKFFPGLGAQIHVYMGDFDYYTNFDSLLRLHEKLRDSNVVVRSSVDGWVYHFHQWMQSDQDPLVDALTGADRFPESREAFIQLLLHYMYGGEQIGIRFSDDVIFNDQNDPYNSTFIQASKTSFQHVDFEDADAEVEGMRKVRELCRDTGLDEVYPYAYNYNLWEGNSVIREELYRNICLAFLGVFLITLLLIAQPWTCLLVLSCVILTLVDMMGLLYYWGVTINTVTAVAVTISIGLAVDYSAHVGHCFMTVSGNKTARASATLVRMGPAVLYGGLSTFLAFAFVADSKSFAFQIFFKVTLGVVLFGLFHGLIYLPVVLSIFGPAPYSSAKPELQTPEEKTEARNYIRYNHRDTLGDSNSTISPRKYYEFTRLYDRTSLDSRLSTKRKQMSYTDPAEVTCSTQPPHLYEHEHTGSRPFSSTWQTPSAEAKHSNHDRLYIGHALAMSRPYSVYGSSPSSNVYSDLVVDKWRERKLRHFYKLGAKRTN